MLRDAAENMRFFTEQLAKTSDVILKEKIYTLLVKEIEKETFAKAQQYYSFLVLDPAIASDIDKKIKPKRSVICILSVLIGAVIAVFLAFFIDFFRRVKADDPERFNQILNGFKAW